MIKKEVFWINNVNAIDDFGDLIVNVFYDGKTKQGPWAIMTPESFKMHGIGTGLGAGQKYKLQPDGKWLKTE